AKWQNINQLMREERVAILAVQETHLQDEDTALLNDQFHGRLDIHNTADPENPTARAGVAIILNKQLTEWKGATTTVIVPGRAILICLPWKANTIINTLAIYAPNDSAENAGFWATLTRVWDEQNLPVPDILLGDFNMVEDAIDRLPSHRDSPQATNNLEIFKSHISVQDGWRHQNPTELAYTFTRPPGHEAQSRSRIDRIYASSHIIKNSRSWEIKATGIHTDHKLISMEFANPGSPYIGKGRWVIPLHLLKNKTVLQEVKRLGLELEDRLKDMADAGNRCDDHNAQTLLYDFKKKTTNYARAYSREYTPRLDGKIQLAVRQLKETLNNRALPAEEKSLSAGILEERIKYLEALRHTTIRDNLAARATLQMETMTKFWVRLN
ncbi:Endonuclease/exonuclease/phosphatase, partial [Pholiota molesta]